MMFVDKTPSSTGHIEYILYFERWQDGFWSEKWI